MSKDLRQFLGVVKRAGLDYYVEVKRPLKPELEVCVLQQKLAKEGRFPVVYCPEIEGSKLPLVTNLFSSYELLGLALDVDPKNADKSAIFHEFKKRQNDLKSPEMIPASEAPVKEVILKGKDVDLGLLPITQHAELDSGKYISIGATICKNPDTGIPNLGVYRHEVKGKDELGCAIAPAHYGDFIARRYAELGKPMEVVVSIGHHPAMLFGATSMGGLDRDDLKLVGAYLGEPLQITPAETVDLPVPAYAEIAIEGVIDPRYMVTDGPFAEYTRYYGGPNRPCYLIKVTAITMRKDAIYHDLDPAQREHTQVSVLCKEAAVYDMVKAAVPDVKAVHCPYSGCYSSTIYVSIKKGYQGQGKFAGMAALSTNANFKIVVVVDDDIDVYNETEVLWAVTYRTVGDSDIVIIPKVAGPMLDPTAYDETRTKKGYMVTKMLIDATKPFGLPFATRITPPKGLWNSMKLEDYLK